MGFIDRVVNKLANSIVAKQKAREIEVIKEVEVVREINSGPNKDDLIESLNYLARLSSELSEKHSNSSIMLLGGTGVGTQHVSSIVGSNASLQSSLLEACRRSDSLRDLICNVSQEILISEMNDEDDIESSQRLKDILSRENPIESAFEIPTSKINNLSEDDVDDIISKMLGPRKDKPGKDS